MRTLPKVTSLSDAVQTVIKSNKADKYNPNYFAQIVANTSSPQQLLQKCTELILSPSALSALVSALEKNRNLLFLEDFVARQGLDWGFAEHVVETARQHAKLFDELVNHTRYE